MHDFSTMRVSGGRPAISVVIPAYNEAERLPGFLRELLAFLEKEYGRAYEVVVVDDGSGDGLASVLNADCGVRNAEQFECGVRIAECGMEEGGSREGRIVLLRHEVNRGKGAALRTGVLASAGDVVLLCDADGAARIKDEALLRAAIVGGADVAVGSRYVGQDKRRETRVESRSPSPAERGTGAFCSATIEAMAPAAKRASPRVTRQPIRRAAGWMFSRVVRTMFGLDVRDTQCGFKMLRGDVARSLFACMRETGYLVDLELLLLATERGYRVEEVPVSWREMPGSKLSLWKAAGPAAAGLWRLHRRMRMPGVYDSRKSSRMPAPQAVSRVSIDSHRKRGSKSSSSRSKASP